MEIICNELSFYPLAENSYQAEERFKTLIRAFREARTKYDFTHIRFPLNYSEQEVTSTQTLFEWVSSLKNRTLKNLILDLLKPPYIDDLEDEEMERFFESDYSITDQQAPRRDSPLGLPVAYIKTIPSISLNSHNFWQRRKIQISKTRNPANENTTFYVYNICLESDLTSVEINEWAENSFPEFIDSIELLEKYLGYTKFSTAISDDFPKQLFEWKETDIVTYKRILLLMKDVELHPFTGGRGRTENLRNRGKEASKRININDRLSYSIENNIVTFIACKGHYEFH